MHAGMGLGENRRRWDGGVFCEQVQINFGLVFIERAKITLYHLQGLLFGQ